jgi:hypothetical protein
MREMAEMFADEMGSLEKFGRNSEKWDAYYLTFLNEAVKESMLPPKTLGKNKSGKTLNPHPKIEISELDFIYDQALSANGLFPKSKAVDRKEKHFENKDRAQFILAITVLAQLYMKRVYGARVKRDGSKSDFEYGQKGDAKKVELLRYRRMTVFAALVAAVSPIFGMKKADLDDVTKGLEKLDLKNLMNVDIRANMAFLAYEAAKAVAGFKPYADKFNAASLVVQTLFNEAGFDSLQAMREKKVSPYDILKKMRNDEDSVLLTAKKMGLLTGKK